MNKKSFYITTAIPYVNAAPHVGHALEYVQTDVIARFEKVLGKDVLFVTGTDDNALKNVQAAEAKNVSVESYVKENSDKFENVLKKLNISNDDFIRTTEKRHIDGVLNFWKLCKKDIYKKKYKGLYCVGCETFFLEKDLIDGKCPEHKTVPEVVEEENYFFKLSNYQDWLVKLIEKDEFKITPSFRKKEVLTFIKSGLNDFSISRSIKRAKGWGIKVPDDPSQIIYVWFDALINYITALGWPKDKELFEKYWPADVQVIGKGISRFHAIYWPAMLKSANLPIPKELFIHGYVTANKEKISKSLGNVIDPFEQVEKYGVDAVRYYLLKEIPAYKDGDYSDSRFLELYNSDLANNLGNLVSRVAKLAEGQTFSEDKIIEFDKKFKILIQNYKFNEAINYIFEKWIDNSNLELNQTSPWSLKKEDPKRIAILNKCIINIRKAAFHFQIFTPEVAKKIENCFKNKIKPITKPLFPRIK
jgi:methionyl-tRNA synthetase